MPQQEIRTRKAGQVQPLPGPEKAFGQALREIRRERGFSQEHLALEARFDRTYVSLIERGLKSPTIRAVVRLAEVLGVKPSEIVARMEVHLAKGEKQRKPSPRAAAPARSA